MPICFPNIFVCVWIKEINLNHLVEMHFMKFGPFPCISWQGRSATSNMADVSQPWANLLPPPEMFPWPQICNTSSWFWVYSGASYQLGMLEKPPKGSPLEASKKDAPFDEQEQFLPDARTPQPMRPSPGSLMLLTLFFQSQGAGMWMDR